MPAVIAMIGRKGSGASGVLSGVLNYLSVKGYKTGVIKHLARPGIEIDQPGKDTYEYRMCGAHKVVLSGSQRYAVFENIEHERPLEENVGAFHDYDWVFLSGYFTNDIPTIEIYRDPAEGLLGARMENLIAVYSDTGIPVPARTPVLFTVEELGDFLLRFRPACPEKREVQPC